MLVLVWMMRIVAGLSGLVAIILALVHSWSGAGQSLFFAVVLWAVAERLVGRLPPAKRASAAAVRAEPPTKGGG